MTKQQKLILVISILASFVAFLDSSVINVALPAITKELHGGLATQQWVVDAYLITLGSLILLAGSMSDLFGRRRVLSLGLTGFGIASVLCAIAPNSGFLIASRGLQGIAGALLVPSSLALIISTFSGASQSKAIGTWTAWTGMAFIIGPLLGGSLVDSASWRLIFAINLLPIGYTLWLMRTLPKEMQSKTSVKLDITGAFLCTLGLGGSVYALIEQAHYGWSNAMVYVPLAAGLTLLALFIWQEKATAQPMLPLKLFKVRNFLVGNLATVAIYAGLSVATFLIAVFVQQVGNYSALEAGMSLMPVTAIMFFLSPKFGALAGKRGPRIFMAVGPVVIGLGFLSLLRVTSSVRYFSQIFPAIIMIGIGLSITVAPLTSAVLGSIDAKNAGVGSAINNAVSRIAGLVAIASLGVIIGSKLTLSGFHKGAVSMAILLGVGGIISAIGITNTAKN